MHIGITTMITDTAAATIAPAELAREVEAHGFDGIYLPEHTHIPASRDTPAPMGDPLPEAYWHTLDPFVSLTAMAAATETLRVGTGICLVAERDPIVTAKEVASLDLLSGGRFDFGVGFGWNVEEMADHGTAFADRRAVTRERVLAMRRLWEDDKAAFDGEHVSFGPSWAWPKPTQEHVPVWLGAGWSDTNLAHLVEYADGWIPIGGSGLREAIPRLHAALEDGGRDPAGYEIVPFGSAPDPGKLEYFRDIGCTGVVLNAPDPRRDAVLAFLERAAAVVAEADL